METDRAGIKDNFQACEDKTMGIIANQMAVELFFKIKEKFKVKKEEKKKRSNKNRKKKG